MRRYFLYLVLIAALIGCGSQSAPQVEEAASAPSAETSDSAETTQSEAAAVDSAEVVAEPASEEEVVEAEAQDDSAEMADSDAWATAWMVNTDSETSDIFDGALVNVTNVYEKTEDGIDYQCIQSAGIPNYNTTIDQAIIDGLMNRPKGDEFDGSSTPPVAVGDTIAFGESVGYTPSMGCTDVGGGYGYWPGGPACPTAQDKDWCFPLDPQPIAEGDSCSTGLNQIGVYVNGVSIFNWQDGQSYNNENVWVNDAFHFEIYDLDVCVGHSANGNYHHHSNPTCLGAQLGDNGSAASPIYGVAADGYPIYGPWESADTLVNSCWKTREYSADSATGCGADGDRSCLLVDQYDISQGTVESDAGPTTSDVITSMSGNPITAVSGAYFQDYYYDADCTAQSDTHLDEHNGHDIGDGRGYHYHTTLVQLEDGTLDYAFPHYAGPTYAGVLQENAVASCSTGGQPGGPPGGGGDEGNGGGGDRPDFAAAAETLGITEQALMDAIGGPPPDFDAAAEALGISAETIQTAVGGAP